MQSRTNKHDKSIIMYSLRIFYHNKLSQYSTLRSRSLASELQLIVYQHAATS